jgi:16S rRNA G966 N2-methylase RsmD
MFFKYRRPMTARLAEKFNIVKQAAIVFFSAPILASCAGLYAYGIVLSTEYDGAVVLENEKNVVSYLENIIQNHNDYLMKAFNRKAISYKVRKTNSTIHSFYVIYTADGSYHTLSFSATGKWATSEGAWAMDTEADIASYIDYLKENNKWEVEEIAANNTINTLLTAMNILSKIRSATTYYFRSHPDKNNNHDNCNTALLETLVKNE